MKDLEKIKSEDLACQVADANPANFAIEQEVAQLVGATVPQPTEPSADDARELGAQLLVFLRRALTPIQTALRTALAAIYAHLDSRCTDYTPAAYAPYSAARRAYDPMGTLPARSVANLLTALTAFAARKISNGSATADGIPDGTSLAHLLMDTTAAALVTEIKDDNHGWTMSRSILSYFPNIVKATLGCKYMVANGANFCNNIASLTELELTDCELISGSNWSYGTGSNHKIIGNNDSLKKFKTPSLKELRSLNSWSQCPLLVDNPLLEEWYSPKFEKTNCSYMVHNCPNLQRVVFGKLIADFVSAYGSYENNFTGSTSNLVDFEIGAGTAVNLHLNWWKPTNVLADADKTATFLQNFREHIALRLTSNGSGKTLTLSQAVRDAIHAAEATYGIEAIIVTQKGWRIQPDAS